MSIQNESEETITETVSSAKPAENQKQARVEIILNEILKAAAEQLLGCEEYLEIKLTNGGWSAELSDTRTVEITFKFSKTNEQLSSPSLGGNMSEVQESPVAVAKPAKKAVKKKTAKKAKKKAAKKVAKKKTAKKAAKKK